MEHAIGKKAKRTPEEEEFIVTMHDTWEKAEEKGRAKEAAQSVLTVLRARNVEVPEATRARILAQKDPERLRGWLERAAVAASVADVLDEPS